MNANRRSGLLLLSAALALVPSPAADPDPTQAAQCDADVGGVQLARGFCARVFAKVGPGLRHMAVAPNGDVYVSIRARGTENPGRLVALRDTDRDGRSDMQADFWSSGGTGLRIHNGYLYFAPDEAVVRWRVPGDGSLGPRGNPDTIVSGLPSDRSHRAKTIAFDSRGGMYVNIGSPSNVCQGTMQGPETPGQDPCPELAQRAGIWRFDANRTGQRPSDGVRWATGVRNAVALTTNPRDGALYALPHGRDRIDAWTKLYDARDNAEKIAEELFRVEQGMDGGWPYCFYDRELKRKVLAPEYGGDGKTAGRCASAAQPLVAFPAHWAPNDILFYTGQQFPARFRDGVFVAFHGSWNRAPLPQAGFNVVFAPATNGRFTGDFEVLADGFAGPGAVAEREQARYRPTGLAQSADGSLLIADEQQGWIWKVSYVAGQAAPAAPAAPGAPAAPAPPRAAPGAPPRAGAAPAAPALGGARLPAGVTTAMVDQGRQLYGTICVACHGPAGSGTAIGPRLTDQQWLHVPGGEFEAIVRVIQNGVDRPVESPTVMPPKGGGAFTDPQVRALAAYVYALSRGTVTR